MAILLHTKLFCSIVFFWVFLKNRFKLEVKRFIGGHFSQGEIDSKHGEWFNALLAWSDQIMCLFHNQLKTWCLIKTLDDIEKQCRRFHLHGNYTATSLVFPLKPLKQFFLQSGFFLNTHRSFSLLAFMHIGLEKSGRQKQLSSGISESFFQWPYRDVLSSLPCTESPACHCWVWPEVTWLGGQALWPGLHGPLMVSLFAMLNIIHSLVVDYLQRNITVWHVLLAGKEG